MAEAGDLFEGDFVGVQFLPFEADTEGTALSDFLEWMEETGSEPTELAMAGLDQRHASRSTGCSPPGPSSTATRSPPPPTP